MRFKFVGNGDSDPEVCFFFGYEFPMGKAVDVKEPEVIAKLKGNSHFQTVRGRKRVSDEG